MNYYFAELTQQEISDDYDYLLGYFENVTQFNFH